MFFAPTETHRVATMLPRPSWMQVDLPDEIPDTLRCAYASKRCDNPRTLKKSGGLHRFCAFHRDRANRNQWRVDHRRRLLKKHASDQMSPLTRPIETVPRRRGRSPRCLADYEEAEAEATAHARRQARRLQDAELEELSLFVDTHDVCSSREALLNEQDLAILGELLLFDETVPSMQTNANATIEWTPAPESWWPSLDVTIDSTSDAESETLFVATV